MAVRFEILRLQRGICDKSARANDMVCNCIGEQKDVARSINNLVQYQSVIKMKPIRGLNMRVGEWLKDAAWTFLGVQ